MDVMFTQINKLLHDRNITAPIITNVSKGEKISSASLNAELLGDAPFLIGDEASINAASKHIDGELFQKLMKQSHIFSAPAKPVLNGTVKQTIAHTAELQPSSLVVIGSGSLSDIGKYAAAKNNLPLIIIATAPSMNGYTSINASLSVDGLKQSFAAKMVDQLIVSDDIILSAPNRMKQAGLSDALSSISAEIDWRLSGVALGTPYYPDVFAAQRPYFAKAAEDTASLMSLLIVQGLGMSAAGTSAPASGGEHMLAHLLELLKPDFCVNLLHGELIQITHPIYLSYQIKLLNSYAKLTIRKKPEAKILNKIFGNSVMGIFPNLDVKMQIDDKKINGACQKIIGEIEGFIEFMELLVNQLTNDGGHHELKEKTRELLPYAFISRDRFTMLDLEIAQDGL